MFSDLGLSPSVLEALARMSYVEPTEVQARTIPLVLEGRDVLVTAQTGTGKTAAFAVPLFQQMIAAFENDGPVPRALVLAPTRELAEQIGTVLRELMSAHRRLRYAVVIGGAPYGKQFRELGLSPAFVVGTPGRILDHIETGTLKLDEFSFFVLDEADRMLDMGFQPQIEAIASKFSGARQTMMFSATLPTEVRGLVSRYLHSPARVAVGAENAAASSIEQDVIFIDESDKEAALIREIDKVAGSIIVFTRTKLRADLVASVLDEAGHEVAALHGDLTQGVRRRVTAAFRSGEIRILVATDIAARGLDIDHVRHVINFDLPVLPEDYIHRIGRTGRAGLSGHAVAFVTPKEKHRWGQIVKLMEGREVAPSAARRAYSEKSGARGFRDSAGSDRSGGGRGSGARGGARGERPFSTPYAGPSEQELRARGKQPKLKINDRTKSNGARRAHPAAGARGAAARAGGGPRGPGAAARAGGGGFHSAEARRVREEFQSRVEREELRKADQLGRKPRFTSESNGRGGAPPSGKKPHKGAPDMRKRRKPRR